MKEQSWKKFAVSGDPMYYLEYAKSRANARHMSEANGADLYENHQGTRFSHTGI